MWNSYDLSIVIEKMYPYNFVFKVLNSRQKVYLLLASAYSAKPSHPHNPAAAHFPAVLPAAYVPSPQYAHPA